MVTYIKRTVPGYVFETEEVLSPELFNNIGSTYEDFLKDYFVQLNEEQIAFYKENPDASPEEILNMELFPIEDNSLQEAKNHMLMKINEYDYSENVNGFTINNVITTWFTPIERSNYSSSIQAAKLLGQDTLTFAVGDNILQVSTTNAEMMLAAIQLYADACFIVTKQHKMNIEALESVEEVENYDYTSGYPEKLNFNLV